MEEIGTKKKGIGEHRRRSKRSKGDMGIFLGKDRHYPQTRIPPKTFGKRVWGGEKDMGVGEKKK